MSSSQPTICQILNTLTLAGPEVLAERLARQLSDRYRFVFACLDELGLVGRQLSEAGFPVMTFCRRPRIDLQCMGALRKFFQRHHVDLVHTHRYTPFFYAMAARRLESRPPILFSEHGRPWPDQRRRRHVFFTRLALRATDRVVAVSGAVRQALIDNEGIPADRISIIHNGVNLDACAAIEHRKAVRHQLCVRPDELLVLQVAHLEAVKDHATAIRAFQRVLGVQKNIRLALVGEGPQRPELEREIARRKLSPAVRLLGLRTDVAQLLQGADLFLLSSVSEGLPVTLLEAIAARLPVVATNVGGVGEVVVNRVTGLLVPAGNDSALAEAIVLLANNPHLRQQLGDQGRRRAEAAFSEAQMHAAYQACYEKMLRA